MPQRAMSSNFAPGGTRLRIISLATANPVLVKALRQSGGTVGSRVYAHPITLNGIHLANSGTAAWIKFYDQLLLPVVGTDIPVSTHMIPPSGRLDLIFGQPHIGSSEDVAEQFWNGLAYAITAGTGIDTDTTAVALGQITGALYIGGIAPFNTSNGRIS